jgi:signal transduction histidine kinase
VIRVRDTGPGIPAAECAAIFEPFYRSEGTSRAAGVGLGLAISHALVKEMGGEITVQSDPGAGAVFVLRLPPLRASGAASGT